MPSPFPGMDPYLEDPAIWPDLHQRLVTYSADALQPRLRPRYHARIGERLYVLPPHRAIYPDVSVIHRQPVPAPAQPSGTAVVAPDTPVVFSVPPQEVREPFIEIIDLARGGRVVTIIEVLSPANKTPGEGHDLYLRKQKEVLGSDTHLVEIDLLRQGEHTVAVPFPYLAPYRPRHYVVCISRADRREQFEVYFFNVRQRMPRIAIPLQKPDPDVVLDLQAVFEQCYKHGAYEDLVDYAKPPTSPLAPEDAEWADERLRQKGLRS